jgi:hypothetical protein
MNREERLIMNATILYAACPHIHNVFYAVEKALEIEESMKARLQKGEANDIRPVCTVDGSAGRN